MTANEKILQTLEALDNTIKGFDAIFADIPWKGAENADTENCRPDSASEE